MHIELSSALNDLSASLYPQFPSERELPLKCVTEELLVKEVLLRRIKLPLQWLTENQESAGADVALTNCDDEELVTEIRRRNISVVPSINAEYTRELFKFGSVLGKGLSAVVYKCTRRSTGEKFACKVILKDEKMNDSLSMSTELEIMKRLRHVNVVRMYELFESPDCAGIVMELVAGGDLYEFIKGTQGLEETLAADIFQQILAGIIHLHSMGVVHRDLKPENILLQAEEDRFIVKITDFGLSAIVPSLARPGPGGDNLRKNFNGLREVSFAHLFLSE
jgi:serine/threonine protein kinase